MPEYEPWTIRLVKSGQQLWKVKWMSMSLRQIWVIKWSLYNMSDILAGFRLNDNCKHYCELKTAQTLGSKNNICLTNPKSVQLNINILFTHIYIYIIDQNTQWILYKQTIYVYITLWERIYTENMFLNSTGESLIHMHLYTYIPGSYGSLLGLSQLHWTAGASSSLNGKCLLEIVEYIYIYICMVVCLHFPLNNYIYIHKTDWNVCRRNMYIYI